MDDPEDVHSRQKLVWVAMGAVDVYELGLHRGIRYHEPPPSAQDMMRAQRLRLWIWALLPSEWPRLLSCVDYLLDECATGWVVCGCKTNNLPPSTCMVPSKRK